MEKTTITIPKKTYLKLLGSKLAKQSQEKKAITWSEFFEELLKR